MTSNDARMRTNRARLTPLPRSIVALLVTVVFFTPVYIVLVNVFKPSGDIVAAPLSPPLHPTLANLTAALDRPDRLFFSGLANSIQVTALSILATTALAAMLGHYLARSTSRSAKAALVVLLSGLMIPAAVILQPVTEVLRGVGLMNSVIGLVIVNVGANLPFGVLVFMGFVRSVPVELEQAAAIDGAGPFRVFWQIVFPLMRPASASVLIFTAVGVWNDFISPLIVLGPANGNTVTVGIYESVSQHDTDYGGVFGFMFLATIPILVFFIAFQKHFVKGLMGGATKG